MRLTGDRDAAGAGAATGSGDGDGAFDEGALRAWLAERLSDYKVPKRILAVDDLPRTGTEKVMKRELRVLFD